MTVTIVPVSGLRRNATRLLQCAGKSDESVYITRRDGLKPSSRATRHMSTVLTERHIVSLRE